MADDVIPVGDAGWDPVRLALVDPLRCSDFLESWRILLRSARDVGDALERADSGQTLEDGVLNFSDPAVVDAVRTAFAEVKSERQRRDVGRDDRDLMAAALLAFGRLHGLAGTA